MFEQSRGSSDLLSQVKKSPKKATTKTTKKSASSKRGKSHEDKD
jgi:hypothetical protein